MSPDTLPRADTLLDRVDAARSPTITWLRSMQVANHPPGVLRISAAHDVAAWPGMKLPGTYNGIMCLGLLSSLDQAVTDRAGLIGWLQQHRRADGRFRIPGMVESAIWKKPDLAATWEYIDFHVTNYTLGAIEVLDPGLAASVDFVRPWLDPLMLKAWLAERDLRDPWQEGNNIVNLASFLLLLARQSPGDRTAVDRALAILFDWHDRLQEPATGFWGVGQASDRERLLHAFAGSMHNFHIWYAAGRPLPYQDRATDYVLSRPPSVHSACIDVDEIDLLVHAHALSSHRRDDIRSWCAAKLAALLDHQNLDGGFCDVRDGVRQQDGWVGGYSEPQGLSNTFATYFRWIAIAMAADLLFPDARPWRFRRMIGIGYRMPMP